MTAVPFAPTRGIVRPAHAVGVFVFAGIAGAGLSPEGVD